MEPEAVHEALQDLTTVDQMLIARVAPVMSVMRLSEYRGGQWRLKGHVVCFPQDIQPVVSVLPHVPVDVFYILTAIDAAYRSCEGLVVRRPFYTTVGGNIVAHFETRVIDFLVMIKPHPFCLYN